MVISIGGVAEDMDIKNHEFQLNLGPSQLGEHMLFTAGWVENDRDKKGRKGGACGKIQPGAKGPTWAIQDTESRPNGTWTRMHDRPRDVSDPIIAAKEGPKRKKINQTEGEGVIQEKEKRLKMDEETKNLSVLMASEFKMAEVAKQPRREQ